VPSLSALLRDPNSGIRQETARALGKFQSNALQVVPELKQIMTDEKTFQTATTALLAIDRSTAMTSLEGILRDTNSPLRARAAARLGRLGVEGKAAIPTLLDLLTDGDDSLRRTVTNALLEIDGSVATNAGIRPVPPRPRGPRRGIPSP
jgi:vesicle coat complex subunit